MKLVVALAFAVWAFVVLSALLARHGVTAPNQGTASNMTAASVNERAADRDEPVQP